MGQGGRVRIETLPTPSVNPPPCLSVRPSVNFYLPVCFYLPACLLLPVSLSLSACACAKGKEGELTADSLNDPLFPSVYTTSSTTPSFLPGDLFSLELHSEYKGQCVLQHRLSSFINWQVSSVYHLKQMNWKYSQNICCRLTRSLWSASSLFFSNCVHKNIPYANAFFVMFLVQMLSAGRLWVWQYLCY